MHLKNSSLLVFQWTSLFTYPIHLTHCSIFLIPENLKKPYMRFSETFSTSKIEALVQNGFMYSYIM